MSEMHLTIRTPEATRYDGPVTRVSGATELGELQVYPGHAAMTAVIDFSRLVVENGDHQEVFLLKQGMLHTDPVTNRTDILALYCQKVEEADLKTLQDYRLYILEKLQNKESLSPYRATFLEESKIAVEKQIESAS